MATVEIDERIAEYAVWYQMCECCDEHYLVPVYYECGKCKAVTA